MDRLPRWADVVLVPLISLFLAGFISALVLLCATTMSATFRNFE